MEDGDVTGPGMQCCLCFVLSCNIEGIGLCYWNHQNNVWRQVDVCTGDRNGNNSDLQFSLDLKVAERGGTQKYSLTFLCEVDVKNYVISPYGPMTPARTVYFRGRRVS